MHKWIIDPSHSSAVFTVRHFGITNVRGHLNNISGIIQFDPADISHSSAEATISVESIYTGVQKRDDHLRTPDFFDAVSYPIISFKSTAFEAGNGNRFRMAGDLTIRGYTRRVVLDAESSGPVRTPEETSIGFTAGTRLNRFDFGVSWNEHMEGVGPVVGDSVQIELDIEADLSEE